MFEREGAEQVKDMYKVYCRNYPCLLFTEEKLYIGVDVQLKETEQGNKNNLDETMFQCICTEIVFQCD